MGLIKFRCDDDLVHRFNAAAQKAGLKPSEFGRAVLLRVLPPGPATQETESDEQESGEEGGGKKGVFFRLKDSELLAVKKRAKEMGMAPYTWVMRLVRAHLTKVPQVNYDEFMALREVSRELSYVGRNLNQVAKALNINLNADRPNAELISEVNRKVDEARHQIKVLLDANLHRWGV